MCADTSAISAEAMADDAGLEVAGLEVGTPTLDDVFLNLTGRSLREGGGPEAVTAATQSQMIHLDQ